MATVSLEMNEINFDFIKTYVSQGKLPHFARILREWQLFETVSEKGYPNLEPWIQWPTVYTGKTYAEHGIFRLGDVVYHQQEQIWEKLESAGYSVGAISPINAANRCANPDFFLPDPWTNTPLVADPRTAKLFSLVRDVVNDNASSNLSMFGLARQILPLAIPFFSAQSVLNYFRVLPTALEHKWAKAGFLDILLADMFQSLLKRHNTDFASLFLNAGAHIQHHHMYDSAIYTGDNKNPEWYSSAADGSIDPLLFIYSVYDGILAKFIGQPGMRLMLSTGLSQIPNEREHYQYRLVDFERFFGNVGLSGVTVEPRMSRDFLLVFADVAAAEAGKSVLDTVRCGDNPLFSVEDRGETLFCQIAYFGPPEGLGAVTINGASGDYRSEFVLVSIENGIHRTVGYHLDSSIKKTSDEPVNIPLTEIHHRLYDAVTTQTKSPAKLAA
jgi:hypothetical protein